ncbi:hypothetical protein [Piscirickettsia litoralis]|uniref:hypothetical protein n=1 Tax=Piscirickettsia litoralis TaxID=1891921 RepID=UPI0013017DD9|nr:hypothetical protein [Piscirickettsia litoralis]
MNLSNEALNKIIKSINNISQLAQNNAQQASTQNKASIKISKCLSGMNIAVFF